MNSERHAFLAARDFLLAHRTDYETAVRDFRWPRLERFNWALDYFDHMASDNPAPALWIVEEDGSERRYSFHEMAQRSNRVANHLRALGVKRGERILMMLGNDIALWESMLAAFKLGAVVIPATALLTAEDLRDRIERGNVRHLIVGAANLEKFAGIGGDFTRISVGTQSDGWVPHADAEHHSAAFIEEGVTRATDPMLLYFTSGTTSKPKMVLHSHQSYPVGHLSTLYWIGLQPGDLHLNISSPGWAKHAWSCFFAPWNAGACVFIHNNPRFNAISLLQVLERYGITSLCAPPTVWRMLIQEDLAAYRGRLRLRELVGAGEPLNPEIIEQVQHAWGLDLRDGFGQTETTALVGNTPGQVLKPGSMGRPLPGYQVSLLDPDGLPGNEGEVALPLAIRPLGLMLGYEDSPEKTAEVMRDGYYRTGDTAQIDADGYITFVGRADDVFKASDYRISPFELESALIEHPAVMEVAVVPSHDPVRLAVPKAFLILAHDQVGSAELAHSILAFAREHLAPYKRVRRIEFVTELPKTISGKIRRVELRQMEVQRRQGDSRGEHEHFEEDFPQLKG
ncbi:MULTISPECIES: AMP-binding protein [unclassified Pseudomonas]|uniref:AMP-binding protein n=1 Tax=unclassified Pseudomonas TaxID=196821 RepID=UPI0021C90BEF|nr:MULTISPECIES: AMP-binding protein [unclassified Pseudomonas]MCU1730950.1 AMP-binding protein [Pseudomonas sp. 20P_3.2_Bac4]MCU1742931.1 AMP-binding protein [Pseudomonas sp. 20P_3.2_Bac5]